jgi:hypothetical protein
MSKARVDLAKLDGYDGPFFPKWTEELTQCISVTFAESEILQALPSMPKSLTKEDIIVPTSKFLYMMPDIRTSDGYSWQYVLYFRSQGGNTFAIALPYINDFEMEDGVMSDRSAACYTRGSVPEEELTTTLYLLTLQLQGMML